MNETRQRISSLFCSFSDVACNLLLDMVREKSRKAHVGCAQRYFSMPKSILIEQRLDTTTVAAMRGLTEHLNKTPSIP